ncbi:bifunctional diaminohydroxyphosphoribosylaminopyrimidine deaminase/5-amino-6-(5-phosphoribosylamino)uracil reductase RibD [Acidiphilium sp. PA]|uniref:bifunctional diaminohydroxyphosphoribosylaminopyrimidine deaminase/5-amino-6-(5-phosphoribosylamino)uracil reductase RibD n=1 Tax=Acidiphilium sp. PA TaxID=2871705 RepID=UPI0022443077|nr:bifunctional diaminohydroxyphosphoribosylaminopyrimidine deaminase/5-amino-6-(5-phosphoribosylamino)uracil reductase RibD [Acidiphilium sp. PA]MCW8305460.1 bifunctional diaminohydroxyphosphoribosylaminopyrimidine deaminase/5-amino-6-(5-phosphoribosylamino)uracil reductase RibD [Acidiphilium sp. PA]
MTDADCMAAAIGLARRGLGETAPNPSVGCVVVNAGIVVGRGRTAPGGRPHAETQALAMAGAAARGATVHVTLEPCAHHGRTPPCAQALIDAGVARVVVAMRDPNPRVNGAGLAMLRAAGIAVTEGIGLPAALAVNAGFVSLIEHGRPAVTLKLATSLDGRIATRTGDSQWITGDASRRTAHALRGAHDAVMIGVGTALADDPELTCRIDGFRAAPLIRIVVDSHLRLPLNSRLARGADTHPLWIIHRDGADPARHDAFAALGARLFAVPAAETGVDPLAALRALGAAGITRLLVEGGGSLAASLLRADLVDQIAWFTAPLVIGGDGIAAIAGFGVAALAAAKRLTMLSANASGADRLATYRRQD